MILSPRLPGAGRVLDALAVALLGLAAAVAATGGFTLPAWGGRLPLNRVEDVFLAAVGVAFVRHYLRPFAFPRLSPRRALVLGVALYSVVFSFITVTRHWAFRTHALDLGYYVQIFWSLTQDLRGPYMSLPEMHAWGDHFSPTLYLLVPLFALFPGPILLLVTQSVAFSLGAIPLFALSRRRLSSDGPAAAFALLYLLSPTLHGINLRDFHIAAFAIPLLLAAVYFFESGRMGWFLAAVILTLGCREDAALAVIGLGLWIALARRRPVWGLGLAAGSLALLFFDIRVLMPYLRGEPYPHLHRYTHLGGSLEEILLNIFLHPIRTIGFMVSVEKFRYLLALFTPTGFLPLLAPWDLIPALPTLAHNLVARDPVLFHHRTQYNSFVLPFLFTAAVSGYARLSPRLMLLGRPVRALALGLAFLVSLALTSRTLNDLAVNRWWLTERQRTAYSVLAQVPPDASVSSWERFVSHLSTRQKVFVFPVGIGASEYVVLDGTFLSSGHASDVRLERIRGEVTLSVLGGSGKYRYEILREAQGYLLLKRSTLPEEPLPDRPPG